jgi:hypothetical protein
MIKILKKSEANFIRNLFDKKVQVREAHLTSKALLDKVAHKYH